MAFAISCREPPPQEASIHLLDGKLMPLLHTVSKLAGHLPFLTTHNCKCIISADRIIRQNHKTHCHHFCTMRANADTLVYLRNSSPDTKTRCGNMPYLMLSANIFQRSVQTLPLHQVLSKNKIPCTKFITSIRYCIR